MSRSHDRGMRGARPQSHLSPWGVAIELARPLVLVGAYALVWTEGFRVAAAFVAVAAVFAASVLVHDLIHGSLGLPRRLNEVVLAVAALLLVKSGHGLRALHFAHHRRCLEEDDVEGSVAHASFVSLLVRGPILAARARFEAFRAERRTRAVQVIETMANVALVVMAVWTGSHAALVYGGAVVLVTITAPVWGAKIPHMVPWNHPVVRRLATLTGRMTPAAASVLLHELHHRFPRIPVSLLPANAGLLDESDPSRCREIAR
jgi:fatty acid desaturase